MKILRFVTTLALILAFFVVLLGAFTRLTDAGLGCPDWPGCYGHLIVPSTHESALDLARAYPNTSFTAPKAWTEMIHRYAAGTLVLLVLTLNILAWKVYRCQRSVSLYFPSILIGLIAFQAALGMWTVTWKLLPIVVMGHLLGGVSIVACLCAFRWQLSTITGIQSQTWAVWVKIGILVLFGQIMLGGWVSANYAGIACIGFPQCNGQWLPALHWDKIFHVAMNIQTNYQGGILDSATRVGIQMVHRLGAVLTALYLFGLMSVMICRISMTSVRLAASAVILLVFTQFALGVSNVLYLLPLKVAVAHNGVAVLLFMALISVHQLISREATHVA